MWKAVLLALALAAWYGAPGAANAQPKFVGNCLSDDGVKKVVSNLR